MKLYVKIALGVVLLIAIVGTGVALYYYNLKPQDLQKTKPDFLVNAADLQKEFETNETGSSAKYINKIVEVTGKVTGIESGEMGSWNITLETGNDFSKIICTFPEVDDPAVFETGMNITIRGECSGFLMDVLLNNCAVVSTAN
jgi:hypothetical protein